MSSGQQKGQGKQKQGQGKQQQGKQAPQTKQQQGKQQGGKQQPSGGNKNQSQQQQSQQSQSQPQQQQTGKGKQQQQQQGGAKQQPKAKPQGRPQGTKTNPQPQGKAGQQPPPPQKKKATPQQNIKKQQKKGARDKVSDKTSGRKKATTAGASQKLARERLQVIIRSKYQNPTSSAKPSELESQICQYLVDLEASDKDLKLSLRDLGIVACREQEITPTKKAILIFVPYRQLGRWQKIQSRVAVELEKKFSGQDVLFLAQRKVMKLHDIKNNYPRPRNQTITSVHERILDDLVYPTKIVGKRLRFRVGGKRILKVYLDPKKFQRTRTKITNL